MSGKPISFSLGGGGKGAAAAGKPKIGFALKPKAKPVAFNAFATAGDASDDDEPEAPGRDAKRARTAYPAFTESQHAKPAPVPTVPPPPEDADVRKVADKLASFVAKNGRSFEEVTKEKNPGDTPFRFLFDTTSPGYKYYEYRISLETANVAREAAAAAGASAPSASAPAPKVDVGRALTGAAAARLREAKREGGRASRWGDETSAGAQAGPSGDYSPERARAETAAAAGDTLAMMNYFMRKASRKDKPDGEEGGEGGSAREARPGDDELKRKSIRDGGQGHHMGDFIPKQELDKFMAKCGDEAATARAAAEAVASRISADNKGHQLLQKMGWSEGMGLGAGASGMADPVNAGGVKMNNLGVGAAEAGEVTGSDDIYEQYKKRMMLGYKHRPNPLNNPRKSYY